jgi:hypothetical protein
MVKKTAFRILAKINKLFLPRVSTFNLDRLTKLQKVLVAYKYWVTLHVLD